MANHRRGLAYNGKMLVYLTPADTCRIGCGTPLIFLFSVTRRQLFYWCPFCEGDWDPALFDDDESNPRLYGPEEFEAGELITPAVDMIRTAWEGEIVAPSNDAAEYFNRDYYLDRLRSMFGSKFDARFASH